MTRTLHDWLLIAALATLAALGEARAQDKGAGFDDAVITERVASALARRVEGVSGVLNTIRVTNRPSRA